MANEGNTSRRFWVDRTEVSRIRTQGGAAPMGARWRGRRARPWRSQDGHRGCVLGRSQGLALFHPLGVRISLSCPRKQYLGSINSQGGAHGTELLAMTRPPGWSARHLFPLGPTQGSKVPCVRLAPAAAHSRGRALQLLSLPRVAEELQLPGQQRHLHGHRLVLLTVDAEGAPGALWRREDVAGSLPGRPLQPIPSADSAVR